MKGKEIVKGGLYTAKVSGKIVTLRVDEIGVRYVTARGRAALGALGYQVRSERTAWMCTNTATGRHVVVESAQRFRTFAGHAGAPR